MIPIIEEAALRGAITPQVAVDAVREAFRADGEGRAHVPAVINLDVPAHRGEFHVKTAFIDGVPHVAVKIAAGFYDNPAKGLPSGSGLMAVFDAATGQPVALLLDNGFLTDIRTGAAGAIAADVLAPSAVTTVGVVGSGLQARYQVRCLRCVRAFSRIVAWGPDRRRLDAYIREMRDLRQRVHPCVGAPGAVQLERLPPRGLVHRPLDFSGDRLCVLLDLPAAVTAAGVFDHELEAGHVSGDWRLATEDWRWRRSRSRCPGSRRP